MKRVFVTGSSGMVGRNLLEHKKAKEFEIFCPTSKEVNILNFDAVSKFILDCKPDFIVHAAGQVGGIQSNLSDPIGYLDKNLLMGRNVLIAAVKNGVKNFINLGSTCIYPRNAKNPLSETSLLTGELEPTNEGYAIAKLVVLKLCSYINQKHPALNYKTVVPCNLYGKYDKFSPTQSHLLPAIIHKIHLAKKNNDEKVVIWGNGSARREFMFAGDFCSAIWKCLEDIERVPDVFNCGVGHDFSINEYYEAVANVVGWKGDFIHDLSKPVGMQQKLADITLQKKWGWYAETSLEQGIFQTYKYYQEGVNL